jgi:hypothetical protein
MPHFYKGISPQLWLGLSARPKSWVADHPEAVGYALPFSRATLTTTGSDIGERLPATVRRNLTVMTTAPADLLVEFPPGTLGCN